MRSKKLKQLPPTNMPTLHTGEEINSMSDSAVYVVMSIETYCGNVKQMVPSGN